MAANALTLRLDDDTEVVAMIEGEVDERLADLLASGDQLRLRTDDLDVSGHATSDVVALWVAGPDDTEGHALALRLPSMQAARDLQLKLIAGGALAVVVASGAIVAQGIATSGVADPPSTTISSGAVHPGQTREHLRTDGVVAPAAVPDGDGPAEERQVINRGPDKTLPGV